MSRAYNEEVWLGKSDTHGTHKEITRRRGKQSRTYLLRLTNDGTGLWRNSRTGFIMKYNGQGVVERHDCLYTDTVHKDEVIFKSLFIFYDFSYNVYFIVSLFFFVYHILSSIFFVLALSNFTFLLFHSLSRILCFIFLPVFFPFFTYIL